MGGLKKQLQTMEREAHTRVVLSECARVCGLYGMRVKPIQETALALINGPLDPVGASFDDADPEREMLRQSAIQRGYDPDQVEAEVIGLIDTMYRAQAMLAQQAGK